MFQLGVDFDRCFALVCVGDWFVLGVLGSSLFGVGFSWVLICDGCWFLAIHQDITSQAGEGSAIYDVYII